MGANFRFAALEEGVLCGKGRGGQNGEEERRKRGSAAECTGCVEECCRRRREVQQDERGHHGARLAWIGHCPAHYG